MKREFGEGISFALAVVVLLATAAAFSYSLQSAEWSIDDKNPQSYAGVVLLMLALQLLFFFAAELRVAQDLAGAASGILLYLAAAAVILYLPFEMSLGFWYMRMDLLSLALFLVGSIALVFGSGTLLRLRAFALFSLLACPLLLSPIIALEPQLTTLTADAAQSFASLLGMPVQRGEGNVFTTVGTDMPIIIVAACAALAAFLSFFAIVLPLSYLLRGSAAKRLLWLASGIALIFALNLARIFTVIYLWQSSGLGSAISFFQSVSGNVLFNLALLAMIIAFPFFGLALPRLRGTSLFGGRFGKAWTEFKADAKSLKAPQLAAIACLLVAAGTFTVLDARIAEYSWLKDFEGREFTAAQANPAELPYPEEWYFLGSDTGFSENYTVTRMAFDLNGTQIQASVFSSGQKSTLNFRAEDELSLEGYTIEKVERAYIGRGTVASVVTYSQGDKVFSTLYWAQPATMTGRFTYAALLFTVADPERNESGWLKDSARRFILQFGPTA